MANVTADAAGGYQVRGLAAGSYVIEANFTGFAPFVSAPIPLNAGETKNIDIKMAIEAAEQQVVVTSEGGPTVSTEAGANSNSIVLKGSDLDALSDDPDELSNELTALAGPAAGPNGGQIYIDGFTGGQLPPKSAIREIRINQNPFSAEFDHIGYGRIEILTKPGTDTLHGRFYGQGNDNVFNTGNPFTAELPSYYSYQYNGTVSGPLSKWASYFVSVEDRETQTDNVYSILGGPVYDASSNTWSLSSGSVAGSLFSPANHLNVSPRIDLQLGEKNTLTMRYQFYRNNVSGSLGQTSLPSTSSTSNSYAHDVQLDDTQVINDRHGERDALRVPPRQFLVLAGKHRAQLWRTGRVFRRRKRRPILQHALRSLRAAELRHAERGQAGHQDRSLAARRPQCHFDGWELQWQLHISFSHCICRHVERHLRRHPPNLRPDRRGLPPRSNGRMPAHQVHLHHRTVCLSGERLQRRALLSGRLDGQQIPYALRRVALGVAEPHCRP